MGASHGPIPDGAYDGDLFFAKGINRQRPPSRNRGRTEGRSGGPGTGEMTLLGRALWKGKVFYATSACFETGSTISESSRVLPDPAMPRRSARSRFTATPTSYISQPSCIAARVCR